MTYCDQCGDDLFHAESWWVVGNMPTDFHSGRAGESATLCEPCHEYLRIRRKVDE